MTGRLITQLHTHLHAGKLTTNYNIRWSSSMSKEPSTLYVHSYSSRMELDLTVHGLFSKHGETTSFGSLCFTWFIKFNVFKMTLKLNHSEHVLQSEQALNCHVMVSLSTVTFHISNNHIYSPSVLANLCSYLFQDNILYYVETDKTVSVFLSYLRPLSSKAYITMSL